MKLFYVLFLRLSVFKLLSSYFNLSSNSAANFVISKLLLKKIVHVKCTVKCRGVIAPLHAITARTKVQLEL